MTQMNVFSDMADALDSGLVKILQGGVTQLDNEGNPVTITPSAAYFNVARQRLKDLGIDRDLADGDLAGQLSLVLPKTIPDMTDEPDAATA